MGELTTDERWEQWQQPFTERRRRRRQLMTKHPKTACNMQRRQWRTLGGHNIQENWEDKGRFFYYYSSMLSVQTLEKTHTNKRKSKLSIKKMEEKSKIFSIQSKWKNEILKFEFEKLKKKKLEKKEVVKALWVKM